MNELQKAYLLLQENCGIKVGDTVRVLRKAKTNELGWGNSWNSEMDATVGKRTVVIDMDEDGIGLEASGFNYPFFVLEKLNPDWTEKLCEDVPALCLVWDFNKDDGNNMLIKKYDDSKRLFTAFSGTQWNHAELAPKELLQAMLERYYD